MNALEKMIEMYEGRIQRIDEHPDPKRLQSNRLAYELDIDRYRAQLEAWRQGKPILVNYLRTAFARALGFELVAYPPLAQWVLAEVPRYRQIIRSTGYPEYSCDFMIYSAAMALAGEIPPPSFLVMDSSECSVGIYARKMLSEHFGVPSFELDCPLEYNEENIRCVAEQLGELIEFAESKVPGIKYDQDKHIELLEAERIGLTYRQKEWELMKSVPFPLSNAEAFGTLTLCNPEAAPDPAKALEFWRIRIEEIEERIARKDIPQEKLRLIWTWSRPLYTDGYLAALQSRGVVVTAMVTMHTGYLSGRTPAFIGDEKEFGRKLSPLEEEGRMLLGASWRGRGNIWVDEVITAAQRMGAEAIVYFQFGGCTPTASMARLVADRAEKELGVPTLIIAGSPLDPGSVPAAEFESRLMEFVDMVMAQKG